MVKKRNIFIFQIYTKNFAIDSFSFIESKRVLFLNSFLKKSTKQYKGEIEKARQILNQFIQGGQEDDKD